MTTSLAPPIGLTSEASMAQRHSPRVLWSSLALGVIASLVSLTGSWIPSLWGDETTSVMSSQRSLPSLFMMLGHVDAVHGSYYLLLHFWVQLFGASAFSVRLPSALAVGFATVAVVLLANRLGGSRLALITGIVFAVLPRTTYMGEEARSYAFSAAVAAWLTLTLVELLRRDGRSRLLWALYCALLVVGIYLFIYVVLFVLVHGLILLGDRTRRRILVRWAVASGLAIAVAAPVLYWAYRERAQVAYLGSRTEASLPTLVEQLWFADALSAAIGWSLIGLAILGGVVAFVSGSRKIGGFRWSSPWRPSGHSFETRMDPVRLPSPVLVAALWLFVPSAVLIGTIPILAGFTARYLSDGAPAAALLMASGVVGLSRFAPIGGQRTVAIALTLVVVAGMVPSYLAQRGPYSKNQSDWAELSDVIQDNAVRGDAVVFDESARPSQDPRLAMHAYPQGFAGLDDVTLKTPYYENTSWRDAAYSVPVAAELGRFIGVHRIWLIEHSSGTTADDYGVSTLRGLGYTVSARFTTHREVVYELVA